MSLFPHIRRAPAEPRMCRAVRAGDGSELAVALDPIRTGRRPHRRVADCKCFMAPAGWPRASVGRCWWRWENQRGMESFDAEVLVA